MTFIKVALAATLAVLGASAQAADPQLIAKGEYLTRAADCEACHTTPGGKPFTGGLAFQLPFGTLYSPNITPDTATGIGGWSDDELVQYLKTGRAPGKNQAAGGMAEAVEHSLQYLPDSDLHAIATYLKGTAPIRDQGDTLPALSYGAP